MRSNWTRRQWMQSVLAGGAGLAFSRLSLADEAATTEAEEARSEERYLELLNLHTSERVQVVFRRGLQYVDAALGTLSGLLRDHRNGEKSHMDPRLYDQLFELARAAKREPHFEVISGYRSPESNNKMSARAGSGVAKKSLHMQGRAIDVRLKRCDCATLRDLALAAKRGGVGYYARSNFVHVDTGAYRSWVG